MPKKASTGSAKVAPQRSSFRGGQQVRQQTQQQQQQAIQQRPPAPQVSKKESK